MIYHRRLVGVGIMSGAFDPLQGNVRLLMPCFVIASARAGMVVRPT